MSLTSFIQEIEKPGNKIVKHFAEPEMIISALKEIRDDIVEQPNFKKEVLKIIKGVIFTKEVGAYDDNESKHTLMYGGPGIGKTMCAKILAKVYTGLGFVGFKKGTNIFADFRSLQDAMIRKQKHIINIYEAKNRRVMQKINSTNKAIIHAKKCLSLLIANPHPSAKYLSPELSKIIEIIENSNVELEELVVDKMPTIGGLEIEADSKMAKTKNNPSVPFKTIQPNDVISRYVGDTAHHCTKMMDDCLDHVVFFDEAYNLCNSTRGFDDSYAKTALTIINLYMSEYADRLVVIFSGYEKQIKENLFKTQPGLTSRFTYRFDMEEYTANGLTQIYIIALKKKKLILENTPHLRHLIEQNRELFIYQGRDMYTLATYTKNIFSEKCYQEMIDGKKITNEIKDIEIVKQAIQVFENMNKDRKKEENLSDLERMLEQLQNH